MITYNELKEKCTCWTGYKRKPGTKPCAEGSCVKEETQKPIGADKHHVLAFGRMNPITTGHEAVVNKIHSVAKEHGASHNLVVSHSQDAKKNPLSGEQKVKHAKHAFPDTNVSSASKEAPTILHHAAAAHKAGVTHLHVVAGSDRADEMHNLLHKYNGKDEKHGHYNFKKITVHSSGERDPDAEGTTGISASKMREHAASGNKTEFHKGAPSKMSPKHKDAMYNDVRKGMNIKEEATPYWKKPSFNKRMSKMAKQERLERERKEAEKKPVKEDLDEAHKLGDKVIIHKGPSDVIGKVGQVGEIRKRWTGDSKTYTIDHDKGSIQLKSSHFKSFKEETVDQQDDRAKQLKRFKDQMSKLNGPTVDPEIALDKKEKAAMTQVQEVLRPEMGAGTYINDFIKSTNPRFNNKSKEERRKMAIGAYMAAKAKGMKEEVELDEARGSADKHWSIAQDHREKASLAVKGTEKYHAHMADHHDSMSRYHSELGQSSHADSHADKAEIHHEKAYEASKQVKEGTMQPNGTDKIDTATSAPTASTSKDTTMSKKIKGFKFFKGENQPNTQMTVREEKKTVDIDKVNAAGEKPHEEKFETVAQRAKAEKKSVKEEVLDEKSEQARRNKTYKNLMAASKGARVNKDLGMTPADTGHKNNQQMNKAIGRAVNRGEVFEAATGNPTGGYHGSLPTAEDKYKDTHAHVKNLTDGDDKTVKHYLDSGHGKGLVGREDDHDFIKGDFKKFMKYYRPEMKKPEVQAEQAPVAPVPDRKYIKGTPEHKAYKATKKPINGMPTNQVKERYEDNRRGFGRREREDDEYHVPDPEIKKSKIKKEENMKSYKEFLQSLDEVKMADLPSRKIQGKSYGASYEDPEGAFETKDDMNKAEKKSAGRKTGQSVGSYKRRQPKAGS